MKYIAVIDTNVIVSALLKEDSNPGKILKYIYDGTIVPAYNPSILAEYNEVLSRNKFGFNQEQIDQIIKLFQEKGRALQQTTTNEYFEDKKDVVFYEIVLTARKAHYSYLVTGNKKHFPIKTYVVSPCEMIEIIEKK